MTLILGRGQGDDRSASRGDVFSGFEVFVGNSPDDLVSLALKRCKFGGQRRQADAQRLRCGAGG